MLPKKSAKHLRTKLQDLFIEIKQNNLSEDPNLPFVFDPDLAKTKRHMQIEIVIQVFQYLTIILLKKFILNKFYGLNVNQAWS